MPANPFRPDDDAKFVSRVTDYIGKGAASSRGMAEDAYVNAAREVWARCPSDPAYPLKLLVDSTVDRQFADECEKDLFCVLVGRVDSDGQLMGAPLGYVKPTDDGVLRSEIVIGTPHGARLEEPEEAAPEQYLLAYLDVLGFEALLASEGLAALLAKYKELLQIALLPQSKDRFARNNAIIAGELRSAIMRIPAEAAYFSDSLLLWVPYHPQFVEEFLRRASKVFCAALRMGLPLRGSVAVGEAVLHSRSNLFLGNPLVEAARLETRMDWIGVALSSSFKNDELKVPIHPLVVRFFAPPLKPGGAELFSDLVLDWPRVWRESYSDSPIPYLETLCRPELPSAIKARYMSAIEYAKESASDPEWYLRQLKNEA